MGHKKRSNSKQNPSSLETLNLNVKNEQVEKLTKIQEPTVLSPSIKLECERALNVLRQGNHTKALRLMKELCSKNETSVNLALIYRVQGTVCVKTASIIDDPCMKEKHTRNAIESAKKATLLSPNSVEYAHFYANLLCEVAEGAKEYDEVSQECQRALAVENPVDPATSSLQGESHLKILTADTRISLVQNELRSLYHKANVASLTAWADSCGNGKIRVIPVRRLVEDPMEVGLVQPKRSNEIKKATKTPEERRKEIEVRVAAARLLQQKSESPHSQDDCNKALDQCLGLGQRTGERKKGDNVKKNASSGGNVKKNASSAEIKDFVQSYWDSMTSEMKINLLKINLSDIKEHFSLSKDAQSNEVLLEAISFAQAKKQWKFWACCSCHEKFSDSESHLHHVVQEHKGKLSNKFRSVLPQNVNDEWIHMLLNCPWKPLDITAAVKILEKQSNPVDTSFIDESYRRNNIDEDTNCFADIYRSENVRDASLQNKEMADRFESERHDNISDSIWRESNESAGCKPTFLPGSLPLSDDIECAKLLQEISYVLQLLIKHKRLAESHLSKVIQFAMGELQRLTSDSLFLNYGVEQTPLCICFLRAPELKKVLKFLQELSPSSGVGWHSEKNNFLTDSNSIIQVDTTQKVVPDELNSSLLLDEHFLHCKVFSSISHDAVTDAATSTVSASFAHESGVLDADALLSWIFTGSTSRDLLAHWAHTREQKANEGMEILQIIKKEFDQQEILCERKIGRLTQEGALQSIEDICIEESKRNHATELVHQTYVPALRKRQKELTECENNVMCTGNKFELNILSNILEEAESLNHHQLVFEELYGGVSSHLSDLVFREKDNRRLKKIDSCIKDVIQKQKEMVYTELNKIDAKLMRSFTEMQNLEVKLEPASAHDYRLILVPLVKSFIRAQLEYLAEKYATEKSDAAREEFLAELALDSEKRIVSGNDSARHLHDRSKEKKKNKNLRKTKDVKAIANNELHMHPQETADSFSVTFECDIDHDPEAVVAGSGVDMSNKEEELQRRNLELEREVRKLEETLEYQRRIENQGKQKHFAEQHKISAVTTLEKNAAVYQSDDYFSNSDDNKHVSEKSSNRRQEPLTQSNGFCNGVGLVPGKTGDKASQSSVSHSNHIDHIIKPSISSGVFGDNGSLGFDRRTGRRGKCQKNSNRVVEGKYQSLPSEDIVAVGQLKLNDTLHDGAYLVNETKTLRQLRLEEDDEERFQADLKRAVCQSLGMEDVGLAATEISVENVNGVYVYGTGLKNEVGEYNCFLNVIIQSLWHTRRFRENLLRRLTLEHVHVGDPCVICALYDIFNSLSTASSELSETVAPTSLRIALSNLYPESNFFREAQMNDASEVLGVIFDCLHRSFTSGFGVSDTESIESNGMGSWDCANNACVAHSLFGMNVFERLNCYNCGLESREMKYTSFFYNINASALRTMKVLCPESCFDELLNLVERTDQFMCNPEVRGCGKYSHKHHILSNRPHVFTIVLGWQSTCESVDDIRATLAALATDVDIGVLYHGLDPKNRHGLISVVCYYGQHYQCFAYSHDHERWVMYDDKTVKLIGGWEDVIATCEKGHLQPQVLFFEAVN